MAGTYPENPTVGQQVFVGNKTMEWNGRAWKVVGGGSGGSGSGGGSIVISINDNLPNPASVSEGTEVTIRETFKTYKLVDGVWYGYGQVVVDDFDDLNYANNIVEGTEAYIRSTGQTFIYVIDAGEATGQWTEKDQLGDDVDVTAASHLTLAQAQASDLLVDQLVRIRDRDGAPMIVRPVGLMPDGMRTVGLPDGKSLEVEVLDNVSKLKWYGASASISNNKPHVDSALSQLENGGVLKLPNEILPITEKITVSKRVNLEGSNYTTCGFRNDNTSGEDGIEFNTTWYQKAKNFTVYGNPQSGHGIVLNSSNFTGDNVESRGNGKDGWFIVPQNWTIALRNCLGKFNEGDGINGIATGPNGQINSIYLHTCTFALNKGYGANLNGTVVNLISCNLEGNDKRGLRVSTEFYSCYTLNMIGCYIETNDEGHVLMDLYPSKGFKLFNLNIDDNYMYMYASQSTTGDALIKAVTDTAFEGIVSANISADNMYLTDTLAHVDLGDAVDSDGQSLIGVSMVGDTADWRFFYKNLGHAQLSTYQKTVSINGYFNSKGTIPYSNVTKSENVRDGIAAGVMTANFPLQLPSGSLVRRVKVQVASNMTSFSATVTLFKRDGTSIASYSAATLKTVSGAGNFVIDTGLLTTLTSPANLRVTPEEDWYIEVIVQGGVGGTYFYLYSPIVNFS